jgi:hypothetical protein
MRREEGVEFQFFVFLLNLSPSSLFSQQNGVGELAREMLVLLVSALIKIQQ